MVTISFPSRLWLCQVPKTAALSPSVPQEVKKTSLSLQPKARDAIVLRAFFSSRSASSPAPWREDGFP